MGDAHGCPKISQWIKHDKTIETHPFPREKKWDIGIKPQDFESKFQCLDNHAFFFQPTPATSAESHPGAWL
jgi:hypothetical protein